MDDNSELQYLANSKRQIIAHPRGLPTPQRSKYTVGWVCALHIELAAAQAMLEQVHEKLPRITGDTNSYVLGSIHGHNLVIGYLPTEKYGTINAATVVTNMRRTFPNIGMALMVGIGGGVPGKIDIRLGDVVVGTRIMQYDLGKITTNGKFERTPSANTPGPILGTAVTSVRAKHEREPNRVMSILQDKFKDMPQYLQPDAPDRLFCSTYEHGTSDCDKCDRSQLVKRDKRVSGTLHIHYGVIASSNQVMKYATTRDNIARELDAICFEMETAGPMDNLPCLPIRGVCDYADSHKSKEWQRYAAATAAAYARDLLEELPWVQEEPKFAKEVRTDKPLDQGHRRQFMDALKFDQLDFRKLNIKKTHARTCGWLLDHPKYQAWVDPALFTQHHGFLWLSGKPGAGKSTIMKFAYLNMKDRFASASFFFNARGEDLERSVIGMYRSLLHQLLQTYSNLQSILDNSEFLPRGMNYLSLNILKSIFRKAILSLGQKSFFCFIDALDECDEQQVRDMVDFFQDLAEECEENNVPFRVCFSSRHYPYISIEKGVRLTLEDQSGHTNDLETYIADRLRIQAPILKDELKTELLRKAEGVFMWVLLVVNILNREAQRGGLSLRKRLAQMPNDLGDLFRDMLRRDTEDMEQLLLCLRWILFAKRPLSPNEFYHALWSGLSSRGFVDAQIPTQTSDETIVAYVISSSKGLAEITKSSPPKIQFIHESVRDFLIKENGLFELWPEVKGNWEASSHETLRQCCDFYFSHFLASDLSQKSLRWTHSKSGRAVSNSQPTEKSELFIRYPFLEYAVQYILIHADAAAEGIPQNTMLLNFPRSKWIMMSRHFERLKTRRYSPKAALYYILADKGLSNLVRTRMLEDSNIHVRGERYQYPIFAAFANSHKLTVAAFLDFSSTIENSVDIVKNFNFRNDFRNYEGRTPLSWAAQEGHLSIVKRLLSQNGSLLNLADNDEMTPVARAVESNHDEIALLLIDLGADIYLRLRGGKTFFELVVKHGREAVAKRLIDLKIDWHTQLTMGDTELHTAARGTNVAIVKMFIDEGADVNLQNKHGDTALHKASYLGYEATVRLLIDKRADMNLRNHNGATALHDASNRACEAIARLLIDNGADVDLQNKHGDAALHEASYFHFETTIRLPIDSRADMNLPNKNQATARYGAPYSDYVATVRLLIDKGADVNLRNNNGATALHKASTRGYETIASLLIEKGTDVNLRDNNGMTALHEASYSGHTATVRLLIDKGADVDLRDNNGATALHEASKRGRKAIASLLIDKGADVNLQNNNGATALHEASKHGRQAVASLLIDEGTDVDLRDNNGASALDLLLD